MKNREVINWLTRIRDRLMTTNSKQYEALTIAIAAMEKQEQDRWILCRDRVPELRREVIVTDVETSDTYTAEYYGNGYWDTDTGVEKNRIIAWKNLPEPYTEEES